MIVNIKKMKEISALCRGDATPTSVLMGCDSISRVAEFGEAAFSALDLPQANMLVNRKVTTYTRKDDALKRELPSILFIV